MDPVVLNGKRHGDVSALRIGNVIHFRGVCFLKEVHRQTHFFQVRLTVAIVALGGVSRSSLRNSVCSRMGI
jgi:hypothetical protein